MGRYYIVEEVDDYSGSGISPVVLLLVLLSLFIFGGLGFIFGKNALGKTDGYVLTKTPLFEYKKITKEPNGTQIGKIPSNTVLKLKKVKKTSAVCWICCYKLDDGKAKETIVLIPEKIGLLNVTSKEKGNKYVQYQETSKTWNDYYAKIDSENAAIKLKCANEFRSEIKNIAVKYSADNILKESLQDKCFILPKEGYLGAFALKDSDKGYYYIQNSDKKKFINSYKKFEAQYKKEKKKYFD